MDYPLGEWIGNTCETMECIEAMDNTAENNPYFESLNRIQLDESVTGLIRLEIRSNIDILVYFTF